MRIEKHQREVFTPQQSQGWLLHQMFSLLLKPGRESCLSAPQPVVLQLPSPSCPRLLFPNRAVPYLLCAPAPGCSMGGFVQRNGSEDAGERRARAVSDAAHRFEEELGQELSGGTGEKGTLVPCGGDAARVTDAQWVRVGAGAPAALVAISMHSSWIKNL